MITKEEVLKHKKDSEHEFVEQLIEQLEVAILYAAAKQHDNLRHPFHPLLENYIQALRKEFNVRMDGISHIIISW